MLEISRSSPRSAGELVREIVPEKHLSDVLQALSRSVQIAHLASPSKWGLRLNRSSIMLKVGFVEVLQVGKGIDRVKGLGASWFHQLINRNLVPPKVRSDRRLRFHRFPYVNAPNCDTCDMHISEVRRAYGALLSAHEAAIRTAACSPRRLDTTKDHTPGLVAFIFRQVGARMVQPSYVASNIENASPIAEELSPDDQFEEGAAIKVLVNRYERDPAAREHCIKYYGATCTACGVSLADRYGPQAIDLIQVHHLKPLANLLGKRASINPIRDLRPVCPNCHAVIHSISPPRTIEEVKKMVQAARATQKGRK